ncbi:MAG: dTDP-4-dehydrorhamnose 3,5-epimerase [Tunicatimonas sp.]
MNVQHHPLEGLIEIIPAVYRDERGYFLESYHTERFRALGIDQDFVQINQSFSKRGVLRGLHFQRLPYQQGKLVSVVRGRVLDVSVDLRPGSLTYGQHAKVVIDGEQHNMLYVPEGFAHGFVALEDTTFVYQCTNLYHPPSDGGLRWDDPDLNVDWELEHYGIDSPIVSEKDQLLPSFATYNQLHTSPLEDTTGH